MTFPIAKRTVLLKYCSSHFASVTWPFSCGIQVLAWDPTSARLQRCGGEGGVLPLNTTEPQIALSPVSTYARLTAVWSRLADDRRTRLGRFYL